MKIVSTLILLSFLCIGLNAQKNQVPNPDFETDDTGWTNSGADSRTIVTPGQESTQAYQITGAANKGAQYITDGSTVLSAGNYIISFWAKGTLGEIAKFKVKYKDATVQTLNGTAFKATDTWEEFSLEFSLDAPKNIEKFILQCGSGTTEAPQIFVADNLFFGLGGDGVPDVTPVDPEFTAFPFTEDFEAAGYVINTALASYDGTTENDIWAVNNSIFDRFWRGNNTNAYTCTVDADAYTGDKAVKLAITNKSESDLRLRTVNIPEGTYDISFYAKTDANGLENAKIGFDADETTWSALSTEYKKYTGTVDVTASSSNGTTRLIIFYTSGPTQADGLDYNIWIDDLTIEVSSATAIESIKKSSLNIYPNPASSVINIQSDENIEMVEIYNLAGSKVKETFTLDGNLDISDLPCGMYIISATVNGQTVQQKFNKR